MVSSIHTVVLQINTVVSWIHDDDLRIHQDTLNNFPSFCNVISFLNGRHCGNDTYYHNAILQSTQTTTKVTEIPSATNTTKKHYAKFHIFTYLCAFIIIPYKEWPKRKPYTYARIADKTRPNGWVNARRADNGTLMWSKW